jgi:D-alanyl-D-alanine carboxypeptidase
MPDHAGRAHCGGMNPNTFTSIPTSSHRARSHRRAARAGAVTVAALLLAAGCGSAPDDATPVPVDRAEFQTKLDQLVQLGVPGVVVMVKDGSESATITAGVSDLEAATPMDAGATFRIASLTKPYTATVVLQLVQEGTLTLDDTVEQWLPGIITNGDTITIRELLHHTSGVADYFDDPTVLQPYLEGNYEYVWTPQQLIEIADELGATSEPGTEMQYSNTNYAIVGLVVEAATGHTLGAEMQTRIFDTLHLDHTTFAVDTTLDPQLARGYLMSDDEPIDVTGVYPFPWGAGNIVSDAADAATFSRALMAGDLLEPAMLTEMMPSTDDTLHGVGYGLGLMSWKLPCGTAYGHDGGFAGYSSRSLVLDSGRQMVILANSITIDDHLTSDVAADAQYDSIISAAMCG